MIVVIFLICSDTLLDAEGVFSGEETSQRINFQHNRNIVYIQNGGNSEHNKLICQLMHRKFIKD
jgi:hypothetical protein